MSTFLAETFRHTSEAGIPPSLAKLILVVVFGHLTPQEAGVISASLLINEIAPLLEKEGTGWSEVDDYHYGFSELVVECVIALRFEALQIRHVRKIFRDVLSTKYSGYSLIQYVQETKLLDEVEGEALLTLVREVMAANQKAADEYKAGKEKAGGSLIGAVMKRQKSDPVAIKRLIRQELGLDDAN